MVVDSSAILSILLHESDARFFAKMLSVSPVNIMSAGNFLEVSIVIDNRRREIGLIDLDRLISAAGIDIVAVDRTQAVAARNAYRRYGRGRHSAGLNFGDCFAYALAKSTGEPLLFKGADFAATDIEVVDRPPIS
ncbi:MAG: type II toxin-antitoxin system VapC family toxin [Rhodospirillales bacterium]|jgi:ribonuclease VapC